MADGFLVVDKPAGVTSHDVVATVRRATGIRKAGHAGTLDPMATGVVVVALGRATRLIRFVQDQAKEYVATAQLGVATDSLDADGAVVWREPFEVDEDEVRAVLPRFTGRILQVPPMVSALKVGGRRLYELARRGEQVEREARPVEVHTLQLEDLTPGPYPEMRLRVVCGKGTYVRSLADDIAQALGTRAHLTALRRLRVGSLGVDEAVPMGQLAECWKERLLTPFEGLRDLPRLEVDADTARAVRNGMPFATGLAPDGGAEGKPFRVADGEGRLLAVYRAAGASAVPEVVLS